MFEPARVPLDHTYGAALALQGIKEGLERPHVAAGGVMLRWNSLARDYVMPRIAWAAISGSCATPSCQACRHCGHLLP